MGLGLISWEGACHSAVTACYSAWVTFLPTPGQQCERCPLLVYVAFSLLFLKANVAALNDKAT